MFELSVGIILLALWSRGECQEIPDAQLIVEENSAFWLDGNITNNITTNVDDFVRVPGVTEHSELALEVKPPKYAILERQSADECLANIINCQDRQITFAFWLKVLAWRESGNQYILQTANIFLQTGLAITTINNQPLKVFFNGDGTDYEYFVERENVEQWTFLAVVVDTNNRTMKVYINGTQLPDSGLELEDKERSRPGLWISIGQITQTPDYYFAGFRIYYKALLQTELERMYRDVLDGTESVSTVPEPLTTTEIFQTTLSSQTNVTSAATAESATTVSTTVTTTTVLDGTDQISTVPDLLVTTEILETTSTSQTTTTFSATTETATLDATIKTEECELQKNTTMIAHVGWPTVLSCDNVISALRRKSMISLGEKLQNVTCSVFDVNTNTTLWSDEFVTDAFVFHESEYLTPDLDWNSTKTYYVFLKTNSTCFYDIVTLNLIEIEEKTCDQALSALSPINFRGSKGELTALTCSGHDRDIYLEEGVHNYTVTWYRNCSKLSTDSSSYRIAGRRLIMNSIDFDMAGTYSCSINYKGSSRFPIQFNLCVAPPKHYSEAILTCPTSVAAKEGESATITCQVDVGFTTLSSFLARATWQHANKNNSYSCWDWYNFGKRSATGWLGRAECFANFTSAQEHNSKCFPFEPTESEKKPEQNVVDITLTIRDIEASDFGKIVATFNRLSENKNQTISLVRDQSVPEQSYLYIIIAVSAAIGIVLFAIFIACLVRCSRKSSKSFKA